VGDAIRDLMGEHPLNNCPILEDETAEPEVKKPGRPDLGEFLPVGQVFTLGIVCTEVFKIIGTVVMYK
jgi:hypothetical protein